MVSGLVGFSLVRLCNYSIPVLQKQTDGTCRIYTCYVQAIFYSIAIHTIGDFLGGRAIWCRLRVINCCTIALGS
jgi:hypothetical protein